MNLPNAKDVTQMSGRNGHRARRLARFPGCGCGNAVESAVWKLTFPSIFCIV